MGRFTGKTCRLLTMLTFTFGFFLVEIVVGYLTNSLALVGDSYHMLSDVVSLLVGFASVRVSIGALLCHMCFQYSKNIMNHVISLFSVHQIWA